MNAVNEAPSLEAQIDAAIAAKPDGILEAMAETAGASLLQVMEHWASVTAIARVRPSGERRAVLAVIDAGDSERRDERTSVRIVVDGLVDIAGTIPRSDVRLSIRR